MDKDGISRRSFAKTIGPGLVVSAFFKPGLAQEQRCTRTEAENAGPMWQPMLNRAFKLACSYILV